LEEAGFSHFSGSFERIFRVGLELNSNLLIFELWHEIKAMPIVSRNKQTICLVLYFINYQIYTIIINNTKVRNCPIMGKTERLLNTFENVERLIWC
jgi:hypothetical protein